VFAETPSILKRLSNEESGADRGKIDGEIMTEKWEWAIVKKNIIKTFALKVRCALDQD
jgi:hypothetical protein